MNPSSIRTASFKKGFGFRRAAKRGISRCGDVRLVIVLLICVSRAWSLWSPDIQLTTSGMASTCFANSPSIAVSGERIHVVWSDLRDGHAEVYYKRSHDRGASWTADARLTFTTGDAWNPTVVASGPFVHVVWSDTRTGNLDIFYRRSTDGGQTWRPAVQISDDSPWSWYPAIACDDSCVYVVALSGGLFFRRSTDNGSTWLPAAILTDLVYNTPGPAVTATELGAAVVWVNSHDGNQEIYFKQTTDYGLSWGPDTRLSNNPGASIEPAVAAAGEQLHVVWSDSRFGDGTELVYRQSQDGGLNWSSETRLTIAQGWSSRPALAARGMDVHLLWQDSRTGDFEIAYRRSTNGGQTWTRDLLLTNDTAQSYFATMVLSDTELFLVWTDERTGGSDVFFKNNLSSSPPASAEPSPRDGAVSPVSLAVYPNPFRGTARAVAAGTELLEIRDVTGRLVARQPAHCIGYGLRAGTYFVSRNGGNGKPTIVVKLD